MGGGKCQVVLEGERLCYSWGCTVHTTSATWGPDVSLGNVAWQT